MQLPIDILGNLFTPGQAPLRPLPGRLSRGCLQEGGDFGSNPPLLTHAQPCKGSKACLQDTKARKRVMTVSQWPLPLHHSMPIATWLKVTLPSASLSCLAALRLIGINELQEQAAGWQGLSMLAIPRPKLCCLKPSSSWTSVPWDPFCTTSSYTTSAPFRSLVLPEATGTSRPARVDFTLSLVAPTSSSASHFIARSSAWRCQCL